MNKLDKEVETYKRLLPTLLDRTGKYALIKGDELAGVWDTYADAIQAGYDRFGLTGFMVKQILPFEPVHYFTRNSQPKCQPSTAN